METGKLCKVPITFQTLLNSYKIHLVISTTNTGGRTCYTLLHLTDEESGVHKGSMAPRGSLLQCSRGKTNSLKLTIIRAPLGDTTYLQLLVRKLSGREII